MTSLANLSSGEHISTWSTLSSTRTCMVYLYQNVSPASGSSNCVPFRGIIRLKCAFSGNRGHLESILQTIIQQVAADDALPPDIRLGVGVLHRLVSTWLKPCQSTETSSVPGFERFIYDHVIPLCFSIPAKSKFDWADAESWCKHIESQL